RAKGVYDRLDAGEAVAWLRAAARGAYDLLLAADTVNYFGDLEPAMAAAARALSPGGLFLFSLERDDGDGYRLQPNGRYAHGAAHAEAAARRQGMVTLAIEDAAVRSEAGRPVPGLLMAVRQPGGDPAPRR